MRIYLIGSDGIATCREALAALNVGEIVVASKDELHAAALGGKRLLALWNALPGVDRRRKVDDREALIDQLWLRTSSESAASLNGSGYARSI